MALNTQRNNVKPMLRRIAVPMMVFFCLCGAVMAFEFACWLNIAVFNSVTYNCSRWIFFTFHIMFLFCTIFLCQTMSFADCFNSKWMFLVKSLGCLTVCLFTFFCLRSRFANIYIVAMLTLAMALFAMIEMPIFSCGMLGKFSNRFSLVANTAGFGYDCLRHGRLSLINDYCLEPLESQSLCGSPYYTTRGVIVNA